MRLTTLTIAFSFAAGCVVHVDPDFEPGPAQIDNRTTRVDGPITQVVANVEVGNLVVTGAYRNDATVTADLFYDWGAEPDLDVFTIGGTLHIDLECPVAGECSGNVYAEVPFDAFLDTTVDVGQLSVRDTMGDWIGSVDTGSIHGSGLTGLWVDVLADTGNIELSFDLEPDVVSTHVRIGDVKLTVPAGPYDVTTAAAVGSVLMNGVTDDPFAARELNATAGTGNIVILGL